MENRETRVSLPPLISLPIGAPVNYVPPTFTKKVTFTPKLHDQGYWKITYLQNNVKTLMHLDQHYDYTGRAPDASHRFTDAQLRKLAGGPNEFEVDVTATVEAYTSSSLQLQSTINGIAVQLDAFEPKEWEQKKTELINHGWTYKQATLDGQLTDILPNAYIPAPARITNRNTVPDRNGGGCTVS